MKRRSKFIAWAERGILAENIRERLEVIYRDKPDKLDALAKKANISKSSAHRIITCEVAPTLDTLVAISKALKTTPAWLLTQQTPQ